MLATITTQTPRVRMSDYRILRCHIENPTVHQKINFRNNVLIAAKPICDMQLNKK